jgi:hypothetical protein
VKLSLVTHGNVLQIIGKFILIGSILVSKRHSTKKKTTFLPPDGDERKPTKCPHFKDGGFALYKYTRAFLSGI